MFDKLKEVRDAWAENQPIVIKTTTGRYLVLPAQLVNQENLSFFFRKTVQNLNLLISFKLSRELEIPNLEILGKSLSPRFPLATQLFRNGQPRELDSYMGTVGPIEQIENTLVDFARYLRDIGDILEERNVMKLTKEEFQARFYSNSRAPGPFNLQRPVFNSLKVRNSINELGFELSQVSKYFGGLIYTKQQENQPDETEVNITETTIINLWRSVNKIQKSEIEYDF